MKKIRKYFKKFCIYMKETWLYKVCAIGLIVLTLPIVFLDRDITLLAMASIFAIPMFFGTKKWQES